MNKEEIFKKIFYYGNENVKKYLYNSINVLCNYEKKTRESIILSKDEKAVPSSQVVRSDHFGIDLYLNSV